MKGGWHYLEVPFSVADHYGTKGRVRVIATIGGVEAERALMPMGDGRHAVMVSKALMREARIVVGDEVRVSLVLDDPDRVTIPEELLAAMDIDDEFRAVFERQTAGMKRGMCHWVASAKSPNVRAQRAAEVMRRLTTPGESFGGRVPK